MCRCIFVMHGTPRPVEAAVARPGVSLPIVLSASSEPKLPRQQIYLMRLDCCQASCATSASEATVFCAGGALGSQGLYDAALAEVLGPGAAGKEVGGKPSLVEIAKPGSVDEAAALKLRKLLARQEGERAELWRQARSRTISGNAFRQHEQFTGSADRLDTAWTTDWHASWVIAA